MPSKTKKQLNFFKLVKAYKDSGPEGVMNMWGNIFPGRDMPNAGNLEKVANTADRIDYADLEDLTSGVEGEEVLGAAVNRSDVKVGYWMKFESWYAMPRGEKRKSVFIAKIKKIKPNLNLANFNYNDIYSEKGGKMAPVKRARISDPEFMWLDYVYFDQIKETGKSKEELIMKNEVRKIVRETIYETYMSEIVGPEPEMEAEDTGGVKIKIKGSDEEVSVKTNMIVQKKEDETARGKVLNVGVNFDVTPNTNNINVEWVHGDLSGTRQSVDPEDIVAEPLN